MRRRTDGEFDLRLPYEVARLLNRRLAGNSGAIEYFTVIYGTVDVRSGEVNVVQAVHPHLLVV